MKNIVVICGSPRVGGNSDTLADAFIDGARKAGNTVSKLYAAKLHISPCIGCNRCYADGNICAFDDDMQDVYQMLSKADVIAFATPVYFYGISAQLKALVDRLHNPIRNTFRVKKLALLAVCADTIDTVFDSVLTMYRSVLKYFSLEDGGAVLIKGVSKKGDIIGNPQLQQAAEIGQNV